MIDDRLFQHYRIDTHKDLGIATVCRRPFDTVLIDKRGSCFACECTAWLPQSIGNLQLQSLSDILDSDRRAQVQGTVQDGTYRLCNSEQCPYIKGSRIKPKVDHVVRHLRLAIDDSCNLRCPSCRDGMVFHKQGAAYRLGVRLADRVNHWLRAQSHDLRVHIGSDGDPFASHVYGHFMEHTPHRDNIRYSILTNGLMFTDAMHRVPHVMRSLSVLGVSIDGASQDTYERLRLGGRWHKIQEQMRAMAEHRARGTHEFNLHMVVQQDNWHEMERMVEWASELGADYVYLNRIQDWSTSLDHTQQTFTQLPEYQRAIQRVRALPNVVSDNLL